MGNELSNQMNLQQYIERIIPNYTNDLYFNELESLITQIEETAINCGAFYDVALGCSNNEHQAEEYFRDDVYENSAEVFELCLDLTIVRHDDEIWIFDNDTDYQAMTYNTSNPEKWHIPTLYLVTVRDEYSDTAMDFIFDDKTKAITFVDELGEEFQPYPTIESEMAYFKNALLPSLQNRTDIEVHKEYNNGGHFHSYNIYLDNNLIEDGVFKLEAESFSNEVEMLDELIQHLDSNYGINLTNIQKEKHNFERYYNFDLNKTYESDMGVFTFTQNHSIHIKGGQGQPRTTIDTILNNLDIDYIMLEFDDAFKEEMNDQISMYEFCNVTEDDIAQTNQKER